MWIWREPAGRPQGACWEITRHQQGIQQPALPMMLWWLYSHLGLLTMPGLLFLGGQLIRKHHAAMELSRTPIRQV